ncbi:MAG TPA: hypothetical protein VF086_18595 [Propionibacteriaceae bacterium]
MDESIDEGGGDVIAGTTTRRKATLQRAPHRGCIEGPRAQGDGSGARWRPGPYRRRLVV